MADYGQPSGQGFYQSEFPMDYQSQPPPVPQQWGAPGQGEQKQYPIGYDPSAVTAPAGNPVGGYSLYSQGRTC